MDSRLRLVFAGGGTGGHLFPALATLDALRRARPGVEVAFLCTQRPIDRKVLGPAAVQIHPQPITSLDVMRPWRWSGFAVRTWRSLRQADALLRSFRPAAVIGTGGYASLPAVRRAGRFGVPTAILNPDAVPGRANCHLASHVDRIFVQWSQSAEAFPPGVRPDAIRVTGCPTRSAFGAVNRSDGAAAFGLDPTGPTLLVTGASQGARTLNDAIVELAPRLEAHADWQLLHLTGTPDFERVRDGLASAWPSAKILAFTDRMPHALAAADLVVSRAGASTLAEITTVGLPSVLLPYPFDRNRHQSHNALILAQAGAAEVIDDRRHGRRNAATLGPALERLMSDEPARRAMARASSALSCQDAARRVAEEIIDLAR